MKRTVVREKQAVVPGESVVSVEKGGVFVKKRCFCGKAPLLRETAVSLEKHRFPRETAWRYTVLYEQW